MSCWKTGYATEKDARIAMRKVRNRRGKKGQKNKREKRVYLCRMCGEWHLTSSKEDY